MPSNTIDAKVESFGVVDPKDAAKVEASIKGKEQAPRVVEQTGSFVDWQQARDELGSPYDAERIPLRKLRQMRRDPMLAFGLHYRKVPLVRAQYHFEARDKNGPNAQVAAFIDSCWRPIHAAYVFQHTLDFDFGSAQIVKRFGVGNPGGVYEDMTETDPTKRVKPVWDEGTLQPVIWKTFVGVPLEKVVPVFDTNGDFDGMIYDTSASIANPITAPQNNQLTASQRRIDVHHSLWATNDKHSVHGNLYGFPLIAHAYRYWWSYWFRWALADRAFERMAVPPIEARHPEGNHVDEEGEERPYWEIAAEAAQAMRSNSIVTIPSTLQTSGIEEAGSNVPEWEFKYIEGSLSNFDILDQSFGYLDVMKLRSIWVPENALVEGSGGTSSRNVAAQMAEIFMESQANKWEEIADHINRFIIPQLLLVNFPEFVNNGGTCRIVGHGFAKADIDLMKQLIQLVGQANPDDLGVDVREGLKRLNIPLKTPEQIAVEQAAIAASGAGGIPPVNGVTTKVDQAAIDNATAGNPGGTNGGSQPEPASVTGFGDEPRYVYVQPNEIIELSDNDDFLASLPQSGHYDDKAMRAIAVQIRKLFQGHFRELYPDFAKYVNGVKTIVLTDELVGEAVELGDLILDIDGPLEIDLADEEKSRKRVVTRTAAKKAANKLIAGWSANSKRMERLTGSSQRLLERALKRSVALARKQIGTQKEVEEDALTAYIESKVGTLIKGVHETMKGELRDFLVNEIEAGHTSDEIATNITQHFDGFEQYKADRIARSEVRDVMNAGNLLAAEAAKLKYVQATDGTDFDTDCRNRNGKLFTIREAWKEMGHSRTHPNCTLGFKPVARAEFSVEAVTELPDDAPDKNDLAWFDDASCTAYVPVTLSEELTDEFLQAVVEVIA